MSSPAGAAGGAPAEGSPAAPLALRAGLALAAAAVVSRTLTCGAGLEADQPGAQVLLDAVTLAAAACAALGRALDGAPALAAGRAVLGATAAALVALAAAAARAPHQDLAWRTALDGASLLALALAARDLGQAPRRARGLLALVVACVVAAAGLAVWQEYVEMPALRDALARGEVALSEDPAYRQQQVERIAARGAAGPLLLTNLLACAVGVAAPTVVVALAQARRGAPPAARAGLVAAAAVLALALAQARSKGGTLAVLAGLAALALLHPRADRVRRRLVLGLAGAAGLVAALGLAWWARHPEAEGVGLSLQVRLEYWAAGLRMLADHPLGGVGLNQFRAFYPAYKSLRAEEVAHAHNAAVEVGAEAGALGLLALAALGLAWARAGAAAARRDAGDAPAAAPAGEARADDLALLAGAALGWLLVAAHGDAYSLAETPGPLLAALAVLVAGLTLARALPAPPPRALAGAALAGLAAFAADGLTDFGLHFADTALLAAVLAGLAPALGAPAPRPPWGPTGRAGAALALGLALAALAALGLASARGLPGDAARAEGRDAHERAAAAAAPAARREALGEAALAFAAACDAWPWHARTWLERSAVAASLGRDDEADACLRRARDLEPRSAQTWRELGERALARGDLPAARAALDEALARYPGHPGHLLAAARARLAAAAPGAADRAEAAALLRRALTASATLRQVSLRLPAAERAEAERLLAALERP